MTAIVLITIAALAFWVIGGLALRWAGVAGIALGLIVAIGVEPGSGLVVIAAGAGLWLLGQLHYRVRHGEHKSPLAATLLSGSQREASRSYSLRLWTLEDGRQERLLVLHLVGNDAAYSTLRVGRIAASTGDDVNVGVRNRLSGYGPDVAADVEALDRWIASTQAFADHLDELPGVSGLGVREVKEILNVAFRDDQGVAIGDGITVEQGRGGAELLEFMLARFELSTKDAASG